jgi:hypothetical protein
MKKQITLQLPNDMLDRLKTVAEERGVGRAIVVEKALARFLANPDGVMPTVPDLPTRLDDQLRTIEHELKSVAETVSLLARYQLAWTSLVRPPGGESYADGRPERDDGNTELSRESCSSDGSQRSSIQACMIDRPFGAPSHQHCEHSRSRTATVSWGLPLDLQGGGNDPFRLEPPSTARSETP